MGDDSEWMKLPTEEKVQHKVWKARLAGYEECLKLFKMIDDDKSPEFSKYAPLIKKFVTDSNAVAQEKGMEATIAFVENASVAPKFAHEVIGGIVQKCVSASKQRTKDAGKEIIMLYIEAEKQDTVIEDVIEGWTNKNPKVVAACVQILREALRDFGNKIIQIKPMVKFLPKLLEDRDKTVRDEAKLLVVEMYRWVGMAMKSKLVDFNPIQVTELEAEFEKLPNEKPQQTRFLKSQQDLKAKMQERAAMADGEPGDDGEEDAPGEDVDPFELLEPVNILAMLPKDFFEKIEAKKWQERKEVLDAVQKLCENPKIEPGDHGPLVKALQKVVVKDTNVMLVALAVKCLAGLANGLRTKFNPYAASAIQTYLEKFKEKKPAVVTGLREAIDAAFQSISLEPLTEDIIAALDNKNPSIKAETASFLARCFARQTITSLPKKQLKTFCGSLLKLINESAPEVRDAAFIALGTAMKVVLEKNILAYLTDVDNLKMQKIKECCDAAVLLNAKGEPRLGGGSGKAAATAPSGGGPAVVRPATAPAAVAPGKPKTAAAPAKAGGPPPRPATAKTGGPPKVKKETKKSMVQTEEKTEKVLSDEAVVEMATEMLGAEVLTQLESANWKDRVGAMEAFDKKVKAMTRDMIPCQVCVRTIAKKPGFKDNNFQVLKARIDLVSFLAQNSEFSKVSAECCLPDLVDKVGDVKNGSAVQEALSCIAEATSLEYVAGEVMKMAFAQKNPKNQSEALSWFARSITEFGLKVQVKPHIDNIKKALANTNPAVRTAAIGVLVSFYLHLGQQLRMFFEDEKPALLQQIDAEFEKVKGQKPPASIRGQKPAEEGNDVDEDGADKAGGDDQVDVADLVPRNDIGEKFSADIIESLSDKNWKVRGEGLQKITTILNEAKFITANLGPLPEAIKGRLGDNNKILVTTTIGICATLAVNMGPHCKQHIKTIGPPLISCFGDSKPQLRAAAVGALNAWVDQTTLTPLVECEAFSDALTQENPNLRIELLGWLIERLPNHKPLPKEELKLCVPHLLSCLEDRNGDVRKKAQEALVPFMIHVGYDSVLKATSKLKPASKDQIMQIIEKARENLPAKQPPKVKKPEAAPAAPTVSKHKAPPQASSDDYDELDCLSVKRDKSSSEEPADQKGAAKGPGKTKVKTSTAPAASKKKKVEEDIGPPIMVNEPKEKRFKDEKNMKTLKWNFLDPKPEYVEQLRMQMEKNFSKTMMEHLFHVDFKFHTKAIETLQKCMESSQNEQLANLDLILKWFTLRFFDTNPSMLNKALEYLQSLFKLLIDIDYTLHEFEAQSFIPYLVIKVGENKDNVRRDVRAIFKLLYKLYPASKMYVFISDGVKSKNSKQRTECLEELGYLIETQGISICQPTPQQALKIIAAQISDRDNGVRNAALNTAVVAHLLLGDDLYKYIGALKEKDQSYLDERIKRSSKTKPPAQASQPPNQAPPAKQERPKSAPQAQRVNTQPQMQRPGTGVPKSQSTSAVRKEFQLDIDDDSNKENYQLPQLIQHTCLDELLQPVELPKIKARPPSPGPKFFNNADTSSTVSFVISQVTNKEINLCIQALAQIDEVLKDKDKVVLMEDHVEQLLVAMSMQFKMAYSSHMGDENTPKDDVIRLYRCLLSTLLSLFQNSILAAHASKDILKELINNLVTMLLDSRLNELEEGPQVEMLAMGNVCHSIGDNGTHCVSWRFGYVACLGAVVNCDSALIRLLQECVDSQTCSNKFLELIMKCLWRMVRMLPDTIGFLNLDRVLLDIHIFLRTFPSHTWKERANEMPLRTIKTVLHSLAKLKGSKILGHLGQIDAGEISEVKTYLQKVLKNEGNLQLAVEVNGTAEDNKSSKSVSKSKRLSKSTHDMLTEIFKKVGSKENTKEGLRDLYDFKKKFPDADIDPFLKKSSHFFQNYIEQGLKAIEREENDKLQGNVGEDHMSRQSDRGSNNENDAENESKLRKDNLGVESGVKTADPQPAYYMERLRQLRAKCGLEPDTAKADKPAEIPEKTEPTFDKIELPPKEIDSNLDIGDTNINNDLNRQSIQQKMADVSDLKARLDRIKQMAKHS